MKTITEKEAAQMLNVSCKTIYRACANGLLKCNRGGLDGKRIVGVSLQSVNRLLRKRKT